MAQIREDRVGAHRTAFEKNRKKILATQTVCGICGKPVDMHLKYPHPMSATVDHIIPVARGGHPSALDNLQLAHRCCNRDKSDKLAEIKADVQPLISNRSLPQVKDWANYDDKAE